MTKVRWGILSTGNIAQTFVEALKQVQDAEVIAVGSRSQKSADEFGQKNNIPKRHASYELLAADNEVDVIYIATPHSHHKDNALLCLRHNKNILVEKAFCVNAKEAKEVFDFARGKNLFVMEAMWTRFFPAHHQIRKIIADGIIGKVRFINVDMSFNAALEHRDDPNWRLYNPDLAGGALLDVGVYSISFASMILGQQPSKIHSHVVKASSGVDEEGTLLFTYEDGSSALLSFSMRAHTPRAAVIHGEKGTITIPNEFFRTDKFSLHLHGKEGQVVELPSNVPGMFYEAEAVTGYVKDKKTESPLITWEETLAIMQTMDKIRAQWNLKYPFEN